MSIDGGRPPRILIGWATILVALGSCSRGGGSADPPSATRGAIPDFSGTWLPDARRAEAWTAHLPLTPAIQSKLDNYNAAASDPITFCMPLGTPRNMLQTDYPLEIVQTPQLLFFVLQPNLSNTETRRIPVDGSPLPESPDASWFGTSRGRWEGSTLVVETIGLRPDALVSGNGLTHSEDLRVTERLSLEQDAEHGKVLSDEIELRDPKAYQEPIKVHRYFVSAPQAQLREGASCIESAWIDKLWGDRLKEHAEARRKAGKTR